MLICLRVALCRTNLPKEVMAFPDLPFPDDIKESFIGHRHVLNYLELYAQVYDLKKHIRVRLPVCLAYANACTCSFFYLLTYMNVWKRVSLD